MGVLLSNSYRMWTLRLVIVLVPTAGGRTWWSLSAGDTNYLEASGALEQACRQSQTITDYDVSLFVEIFEDGKSVETGILQYFVEGDNYYRYIVGDENTPKSEQLYVNSDMYHRYEEDEGKWRKIYQTTAGDKLGFPLGGKSICPELGLFRYAGEGKDDDQNIKRFTADTIKPHIHPYGEIPIGGEATSQNWDWEIWIDNDGYMVKAAWRIVDPKWEGEPHVTLNMAAVFSGHGEPNVLPDPSPTN